MLRAGSTGVPTRTYLVRFDDLCAAPEHEVSRLARFLGIDPGRDQLRSLSVLVRRRNQSGRYRLDDLAGYDTADLQAVSDLGFGIGGLPAVRPTRRQSVAIPISAAVPSTRSDA